MQADTTENNTPMWAILELMGHVKTGALLSKDTQLGTAMLRADVPQADGTNVTQLVNPSSIYRITFCSEEIARACAAQCSAKPMESFDMKTIILYAAVSLVTYAVRMRGWTNEPKPAPYPQDEHKAWWRWIAERQIQSTDLPGAFRACITELEQHLKK